MLTALLFVILVLFVGGICMYILARFVEGKNTKKGEPKDKNMVTPPGKQP